MTYRERASRPCAAAGAEVSLTSNHTQVAPIMNAAANALQSVLGDLPSATQSFANPSNDADKFADPSGATMQALVWHGKNDVRIDEVAKPRIVDPTDVLVKVTGSTVCGSGEFTSSPRGASSLTCCTSLGRPPSSPWCHHSAEERRCPWTRM